MGGLEESIESIRPHCPQLYNWQQFYILSTQGIAAGAIYETIYCTIIHLDYITLFGFI